MIDLGVVTRVCVCGSEVWLVQVTFDDDWTVGTYSLEGVCAACGATALMPTEVDHPDYPGY